MWVAYSKPYHGENVMNELFGLEVRFLGKGRDQGKGGCTKIVFNYLNRWCMEERFSSLCVILMNSHKVNFSGDWWKEIFVSAKGKTPTSHLFHLEWAAGGQVLIFSFLVVVWESESAMGYRLRLNWMTSRYLPPLKSYDSVMLMKKKPKKHWMNKTMWLNAQSPHV